MLVSLVQRELAELRLQAATTEERVLAYQLRDLLTTQCAVLTAMTDYAQRVTLTRGSALYTDEGGQSPKGLEEIFRFRCGPKAAEDQIQQVRWTPEGCAVSWRSVRPLPVGADVFETVWRQYRENGNVY